MRWAAIFAVWLAASATAFATERRVEIAVDGGPIVGSLNVDETGAPQPAVLLLHGFTGSRDEMAIEGTNEGIFSRTSRRLAAAGVASLRIDFRGSGDSGGDWRDTTFSGQIADAVAALDWLRAQPGVDPARVAVLGWSQGGLVGAHVAAERPDVAALILWAPAQNPLWHFSGFLGVETTMSALAAPPDQEVTVLLPWGDETTLRAGFWQEMAVSDPVAAVAHYPGPLLVIVGTRDAVVTPQPAGGQIFLRYHDGPEELVVLDADHAFDVQSGPEVLDGMIDRLLAFLDGAPG